MKKKYNWVQEGNGYLAIGGRPSMQGIDGLKADNCTTIVTLLKDSESNIAREIGEKVQSTGIDWIWFPLSASHLPEDKALEKAREVFQILKEKLDKGEHIFIHCAAGIHRTGAFTYGLLRYAGNAADNAKEKIKTLRPVTLEQAQPKHWDWGEQFGEDYVHIIQHKMEKSCVFCQIVQRKLPASIVFENDTLMAIMDIQPINEGHVIVFPKHCYQILSEVPAELSQELFATVTKIEKTLWNTDGLNCEGTNILQNNGQCAGQEIHHVHFHIIPRFAGDGFKFKYQAKRPGRADLDLMSEKIKSNLLTF